MCTYVHASTLACACTTCVSACACTKACAHSCKHTTLPRLDMHARARTCMHPRLHAHAGHACRHLHARMHPRMYVGIICFHDGMRMHAPRLARACTKGCADSINVRTHVHAPTLLAHARDAYPHAHIVYIRHRASGTQGV